MTKYHNNMCFKSSEHYVLCFLFWQRTKRADMISTVLLALLSVKVRALITQNVAIPEHKRKH